MSKYYEKKAKKKNKKSKYVVDDDLEESLSNLSSISQTKGKKINLEHLDAIVTVGKSFAGYESLVKHHTNYYMLDVRKKSELIRLKQVTHVNNELEILGAVDHPFIVHLYRTFQDEKCIYFLMEYCIGGDLLCNLQSHGLFSNDEARFCTGEVLLALEYLHEVSIIHRNVRPENVLFTETGHLKLAGFQFSKFLDDEPVAYTFCGTPEYLAPEMVQSQGHGKAVDYWALGILICEQLCGQPPFQGDSPVDVYEQMLTSRPQLPSHVDGAARDLVLMLLQRDPSKRIGNLHGGAEDVKQHRWFKGLNWPAMNEQRVHPPERFIPNVSSPGDHSCYLQKFENNKDIEQCGPETDPFKEYFSAF